MSRIFSLFPPRSYWFLFSLIGVEKTYKERIYLRLDFEVTVDLTDTTTTTYKKLFQDTFTGVKLFMIYTIIKIT